MRTIITTLILLLLAVPAFAGTKTITAERRVVMGDTMSKADASRLCAAQAKRAIVEEAGVFLETDTKVNLFQLQSDELRMFTSAFISVQMDSERVEHTADTMAVICKARADVDPEAVQKQIAKARENEAVMALLKHQKISTRLNTVQIIELEMLVHMLQESVYGKRFYVRRDKDYFTITEHDPFAVDPWEKDTPASAP